MGVKHVYSVGLAFDYCVGSTAIDAAKYDFHSYIIKDATKAVAPDSETTMQERLDKAGVKIITSDAILSIIQTTIKLEPKTVPK